MKETAMRFEINNMEWTIKQVEQNELCSIHNDFTSNGCYYGSTFPSIQEIWIYKDLKEEQKEKTLYHELMHCYIYSFVSFNDIEYTVDDFCDISANSHKIIHKIVQDYFDFIRSNNE